MENEAGSEERLTPEQEDAAWKKVIADREAQKGGADAGTETTTQAGAAGTEKQGEKPADKPADSQVEKPAGDKPAQEDPYAGLPEPTRKLIEGLGTRVSTLDSQLSKANGTIGNLKQRLDESQEALKQIRPTVDAVEADKKNAAKAAADERQARIRAAREKLGDMPDVVEYLDLIAPPEAAADAKPADKGDKGEKVGDKTDERPVVEKSAEAIGPDERRVLILQRELSDRVPGWLKTRDTPEFKAWLPKSEFAAKANSWDPDEAASVFQAFEKHKSDAAQVAKVEKDRQERLRRGEGVQGRGSSSGDVDTSPDALWNQAKRDREKARAA